LRDNTTHPTIAEHSIREFVTTKTQLRTKTLYRVNPNEAAV